MRRSAPLALLGSGFFALVSVWLLSGSRLLPVYDTVLPPSQPYRYVEPPAGVTGNVTPQPASMRVSVKPGKTFPLTIVETPELLPQARLDLLDGAFKIPPGTRSVVVKIRPVKPPAPLQSTIEPASNVYFYDARSDTGHELNPVKGLVSVDLLAYRRHGTPFIERYQNGHWQPLATGAFVGVNVYSSPVTKLGYFVVVTHGGPGASGSSSSPLRTILIAIAALLLLAAAIILLMRYRAPSRTRAR